MKQKTRSKLDGKLAEAVDGVMQEGEDIKFEVATYRGHGLVVTDRSLILVVGGMLAGLKPKEVHLNRLPMDKITSVGFKVEPPGCFLLLGIPPVNLIVKTKDDYEHDKSWDTIAVDYNKIGEAARLIAHVHEFIGHQNAQEGG